MAHRTVRPHEPRRPLPFDLGLAIGEALLVPALLLILRLAGQLS